MNEPNLVIIGGGTGCATLFPEITHATPHATAIVAMSDDGGSTGRLVHQLGLMPMGDLRNVMFAASEDKTVRALAARRFDAGELRGHHWGNILLAACFEQFGVAEGVRRASELLRVRGTILPVTVEPNELVMRDGRQTIHSEHRIDVHHVRTKKPLIYLKPAAALNPQARQAIAVADLIVISPGSMFTSILAALAVDGMHEALSDSHAPKVLITNLMTEPHQTDGWHVTDFVTTLERYGVNVNVVLYNTKMAEAAALRAYAIEGQRPVGAVKEDLGQMAGVRTIGLPMLAKASAAQAANDSIPRSLVRHDAAVVREALWNILAKP